MGHAGPPTDRKQANRNTKHTQMNNRQRALRSPPTTQQQPKDPKAPRNNQTDHDQGAHNTPTKHKHMNNGHGARRPRTDPTDRKQANRQTKNMHMYNRQRADRPPRTNPTTAKGPAGPPQQPNRQQTGKTKPKQNTHKRTIQPEGPQPPRTNPYIQNIHTKQWPKRSKRPSCATAQATRSARSTRAEAGPPLHILGVVWGDKGSRLWNAAGGARGDVI